MKFERLEVLIDVTVLKLSFKDYVFYFRSWFVFRFGLAI